MKSKLSEISTVIIVNKSREPKTIQIKSKHLSRLRHYAAIVVGVIVILSVTVVYLRSQNAQQEEEKDRLMAQITKLKIAIPPPAIPQTKTNTAQNYIQSIEAKLQKINDYLKKRGLKGFSNKAVGGNGNTEGAKLTDEETYSLYDEYLSRLVHSVAFTPMGYPRISSLTSMFGYRSDPFNSASAEFHPGIDFRGAVGDEAHCTANGKVVFAGWYGGYGNCVRIAHANSYETLYGHLSRITVKVGQEVTVGQKIGEVGSTGHSTGAHLHYEVRLNGKPINPIKFLTLNN
ncbi:murein DD-endopeptidase MepM/ murein hydrolase activator NlpD [Mucilaginibacter frigoritolerans]|jgi:murein DD-endopeptidase MepM/ murein hydrolase activator NlpD|uniref:Murein DD-endopeptidase MepM/ murein hydrolase activator NlpD n=1 Tax=Mucilaginibacter frigoritolerans TaxID=652788 RepID=A0A562TMG1_9SPHI|nr:M23 family metallopeptidase [Mucilaginibacter frigoritolerans]TWI94593.1 murein DD-endopeptidase MepM/ murein hydrolase activator NlpD [Mucilaginibacter frigoritolerans]